MPDFLSSGIILAQGTRDTAFNYQNSPFHKSPKLHDRYAPLRDGYTPAMVSQGFCVQAVHGQPGGNMNSGLFRKMNLPLAPEEVSVFNSHTRSENHTIRPDSKLPKVVSWPPWPNG